MAMKIFLTILFSLVVGQTLKAFLHYHKYHKVNLWVYLEDGGMPSTHSTALGSLVTALFYDTGFSTVFVAALFISLIILNDSMKVERQQGIQSELMARFIDVRDIIRRKFTESTGHTPEQVFSGALLGFFIASLVYAF